MKAQNILLLGVLTITASVLNATMIDYVASVDGLAASPDYSFSATGGSVVIGNKNGVKFLGVSGGQTGTEIDGNQSLKIAFSSAEQLASLSFVLLFNGGEYGDYNEIAAAETNNGDKYQLRVVGENSAKWYKNNVFLNDVAGFGTEVGGQGKFVINNPFGVSAVTSFNLTAVDSIKPGKDGSDFGLSAFSTFDLTSVPDGGSVLALIGLAMIGLAAIPRRFRTAQG
ncbi:MAG TPA: hypothetical protein VIM71_12410 [Lacunisphaera sp.]